MRFFIVTLVALGLVQAARAQCASGQCNLSATFSAPIPAVRESSSFAPAYGYPLAVQAGACNCGRVGCAAVGYSSGLVQPGYGGFYVAVPSQPFGGGAYYYHEQRRLARPGATVIWLQRQSMRSARASAADASGKSGV